MRYLIKHYRDDIYLGTDHDYVYAGCHDAPEMITGDCYARRLAMERTIGTRPYTVGLPEARITKPDSETATYRKAQGLTCRQLGMQLGLNWNTVSEFERGRLKRCMQKTWGALASFYGEDAVAELRVVTGRERHRIESWE